MSQESHIAFATQLIDNRHRIFFSFWTLESGMDTTHLCDGITDVEEIKALIQNPGEVNAITIVLDHPGADIINFCFHATGKKGYSKFYLSEYMRREAAIQRVAGILGNGGKPFDGWGDALSPVAQPHLATNSHRLLVQN